MIFATMARGEFDIVKLVVVCFLSMVIAQILKLIFNFFKTKKLDYSLLFSNGGMPSSHTSTVITLVVSIALYQYRIQGFLDETFLIALVLAMVVIHDAMNVRLESGKHAKILNQLITDEEERKERYGLNKSLKERLGHFPREIIAGAILGTIIAFIGFFTL